MRCPKDKGLVVRSLAVMGMNVRPLAISFWVESARRQARRLSPTSS